MENVVEHIRNDMKEAMKARDALRLETLRGVLSAFTNELVAKGKKPQDSLSDAEALVVLKRLTKQRREAADQFKAGGRIELASKEEAELEILSHYLPPELSREEVVRIAKEEFEKLEVKDTSAQGKLMGAIMKASKGQANSQTVSEVVNQLFKERN